MDAHFDKLEKFLYDNINSDIFGSPETLYKAFIKVEESGKQSRFNYDLQLLLFYKCAYLYNNKNGLQSISKIDLPFSIKQDISFDEFLVEIKEGLNIPLKNNIIQNDNFHDLIIRGFMKRILKHDSWGGWTFIEYSAIQGDNQKQEDITKKIYLSIDNKDLHNFALLLLEKCSELGIKYEFKINADDDYRRADNVVIYTSDEDLPKYISLINKIKDENPNIDYGNAHLLAYNYNEYIAIASFEGSDSKISHSQNICSKICTLRNNEDISFEHFFENVKLVMLKEFSDIINFFDKYPITNENNEPKKY